MGKLKEFHRWLLLYLTYLEGRGINEKTVRTHQRVLMEIYERWGDPVTEDREKLLARAWEDVKNGKTRRKYNQAIKWFKDFMKWFNEEGISGFRSWLIREGYSEHTVKEYYYILIAPVSRINRSQKELRRFENALSTFRRYVNAVFPRAP